MTPDGLVALKALAKEVRTLADSDVGAYVSDQLRAIIAAEEERAVMQAVKLCNCEIIVGGQMVDNPSCPFHHGATNTAHQPPIVTRAEVKAYVPKEVFEEGLKQADAKAYRPSEAKAEAGERITHNIGENDELLKLAYGPYTVEMEQGGATFIRGKLRAIIAAEEEQVERIITDEAQIAAFKAGEPFCTVCGNIPTLCKHHGSPPTDLQDAFMEGFAYAEDAGKTTLKKLAAEAMRRYPSEAPWVADLQRKLDGDPVYEAEKKALASEGDPMTSDGLSDLRALAYGPYTVEMEQGGATFIREKLRAIIEKRRERIQSLDPTAK